MTRAFEAALDLHLTLSEVTEENTATQLRTAIAALDEVINRLRHAALAQEVDDRL